MEIRNLQKTGGASLTLTLPKHWVKKFFLKDKDKVAVFEHRTGNLIIQPLILKRRQLSIKILIEKMALEELKREIEAYYLSGVDEIVLKSPKITFTQRRLVKDTINALVGMEILEETSEKIVIKNIFDNKKFSTPQAVEKMFIITLGMYEGILTIFNNNDRELAKDIIERDEEIDKLYLAILRQFNSLLHYKTNEEELGVCLFDLSYYAEVAIQVERIADHIVKMSKLILAAKVTGEKLSPSLQRKAKKNLILIQEGERIIRFLDKKTAHHILDTYSPWEKETYIKKGINKKSSVEIIFEDSFDRIQGYINNLAELTIDYINGKESYQLRY